jgi:UDP-N-acetylmuramyl tripeptide synthase
MPRTRKYADAAEKQAAYRARLTQANVLIDRRAQNLMIRRLDALHEAVNNAAKSGDVIASACRAASPETVIENLTRHFEDVERIAQSRPI